MFKKNRVLIVYKKYSLITILLKPFSNVLCSILGLRHTVSWKWACYWVSLFPWHIQHLKSGFHHQDSSEKRPLSDHQPHHSNSIQWWSQPFIPLGNHGSEIQTLLSLVKIKSQVSPTLKGRILHKVMNVRWVTTLESICHRMIEARVSIAWKPLKCCRYIALLQRITALYLLLFPLKVNLWVIYVKFSSKYKSGIYSSPT